MCILVLCLQHYKTADSDPLLGFPADTTTTCAPVFGLWVVLYSERRPDQLGGVMQSRSLTVSYH
jgi:hypothetical protein